MNSGNVWETVASVLTPEQQKRVQALAKDPSVLAEVARDVDAGNREPVKSTPTIILAYGSPALPDSLAGELQFSAIVAQWLSQIIPFTAWRFSCALRSAWCSSTPPM